MLLDTVLIRRNIFSNIINENISRGRHEQKQAKKNLKFNLFIRRAHSTRFQSGKANDERMHWCCFCPLLSASGFSFRNFPSLWDLKSKKKLKLKRFAARDKRTRIRGLYYGLAMRGVKKQGTILTTLNCQFNFHSAPLSNRTSFRANIIEANGKMLFHWMVSAVVSRDLKKHKFFRSSRKKNFYLSTSQKLIKCTNFSFSSVLITQKSQQTQKDFFREERRGILKMINLLVQYFMLRA